MSKIINRGDMNKTILISIPVEDLQTLIIDSVNTCLKYHKGEVLEPKDSNDILSVPEASEFLNLAVPTIYALTSNRTLPHFKKGKKLYFSRATLTKWIESGKRSSVREIQNIAKQKTAA